MTVEIVSDLWEKALRDLLEFEMKKMSLLVLSKQTVDSIRRVNIYETYREKAQLAEQKSLPFHHTSNPFTLCQRASLSNPAKVWVIYLATYFGKSLKSGWLLFNRSIFQEDKSMIHVEQILEDREAYYNYLRGLNFFDSASYSNHRKFTKKSLDGHKGFIQSVDYFLDHLDNFVLESDTDFDHIYTEALKVPNFGRMAAFDFTSNLCKCGLGVKEPTSLYTGNSTGPLKGLKKILSLAGSSSCQKSDQIEFGEQLLRWFLQNTNIKMCAQVIEDAICNWQKDPQKYIRYFG